MLAKQVLEHRNARAGRVDRLRHLRKLHRVTEQDERPRGRAERERVRERDLPGLVDEEVIERPVELRPAEEPGRAGDELHLRVGEARVAPGRLTKRPVKTESPRPTTSSARGTRRLPRQRLLRPRGAGCGSPCGSSRRRRPACRARAGARSAARQSTSCPTRAGPARRGSCPRPRPRAASSLRASRAASGPRRAAARGAAAAQGVGSDRRRSPAERAPPAGHGCRTARRGRAPPAAALPRGSARAAASASPPRRRAPRSSRHPARRRVVDAVARLELVLLVGKREVVVDGLRRRQQAAAPTGSSRPIASRPQQLLGRPLEAREEGAPRGPRLAAVVLEQIGEELQIWVAGREQALAGRVARSARPPPPRSALAARAARARGSRRRTAPRPPPSVRRASRGAAASRGSPPRCSARSPRAARRRVSKPALVVDDRVDAAGEVGLGGHEELAHVLDRVPRCEWRSAWRTTAKRSTKTSRRSSSSSSSSRVAYWAARRRSAVSS